MTSEHLPDPISVMFEFELEDRHYSIPAKAIYDRLGAVSFELDTDHCDDAFIYDVRQHVDHGSPINASGRTVQMDEEHTVLVFEDVRLHVTHWEECVGANAGLIRGVFTPAEPIFWSDPVAPSPTSLRLYVHDAPTYGSVRRPIMFCGYPVTVTQVARDPRVAPAGSLSFIVDVGFPDGYPSSLNYDDVSDVVFQFECLVSLALGCETRVSLMEWRTNEQIHASFTSNRVVARGRGHALIRGSCHSVIDFLKEVYPNYRRERENLALDVLLDLYVQGCAESYIDLRFAKWAFLMEAAKFHTARTHLAQTGLVQPQNSPRGFIQGFKAPGSNGKLSFRTLLQMTFEYFGYSPPGGEDTFTFISERNAIFHTGRGSHHQTGEPDVLREELERLHTQAIKLLFLILGYTGEFNPPRFIGYNPYPHVANYRWDEDWFDPQ